MVFVALVILFLLPLCLLALWPEPAEPARKESAPAPAARPESLEGVLVAELVAGRISRDQYARELAKLAARDDERHPLTVPPDSGPAAV